MIVKTTLFLALNALPGNRLVEHITPQTFPTVASERMGNSTILLNAEDIGNLRLRQGVYTKLIRAATTKLDYQPKPVEVLDPAPHYTATGVNPEVSKNKLLATDAQVAYRAGLCYLLTGDGRFASNAQRILDAWAGTLKQVTTEQGKAAICFNMPYMIMAASWVRGANDWKGDGFGLFLSNTILPQATLEKANNHGIWASLLVASGAAYLGDAQRLEVARNRWQELMETGVKDDGSMPLEMERSGTNNWRGGPDKGIKGMAYTHYALLPASIAAKIFADQGKPVWQTKGGQRLQAAFARAASWTLHPETFPYYASNGGKLDGLRNASYFSLLLRYYPNQDAEAVLKQGDIGMDGFLLPELFGQ